MTGPTTTIESSIITERRIFTSIYKREEYNKDTQINKGRNTTATTIRATPFRDEQSITGSMPFPRSRVSYTLLR